MMSKEKVVPNPIWGDVINSRNFVQIVNPKKIMN